jgi:hypothetical protein
VVITARESTRRKSDQYVTMTATEWTVYDIWSDSPGEYQLTMRVKSVAAPAEIQLAVGNQVRRVAVPQKAWSEINLGPIALSQGTNRLQCLVTSGVADLDWLELSREGNNQPAASRRSSVLFP